MKKMTYFFVIIYIISCRNNKPLDNEPPSHKSTLVRQGHDSSFVKYKIIFNENGDTSDIHIELLDNKLQIHYYKNKPQFFNYDNDRIINDQKATEFIKERKGLYMSLNDSNQISSFGLKYYTGSKAVDVGLTTKGTVQYFNVWNNYTNYGYRIEVDKLYNNKMILYGYNENDKTDSTIYIPKVR